jgi:hypothetical protein
VTVLLYIFPEEFSWSWHNPSAASNPSGHYMPRCRHFFHVCPPFPFLPYQNMQVHNRVGSALQDLNSYFCKETRDPIGGNISITFCRLLLVFVQFNSVWEIKECTFNIIVNTGEGGCSESPIRVGVYSVTSTNLLIRLSQRHQGQIRME